MNNLILLYGKSSNRNNIINIEIDFSVSKVDCLKITKDDLTIEIEGICVENNVG